MYSLYRPKYLATMNIIYRNRAMPDQVLLNLGLIDDGKVGAAGILVQTDRPFDSLLRRKRIATMLMRTSLEMRLITFCPTFRTVFNCPYSLSVFPSEDSALSSTFS